TSSSDTVAASSDSGFDASCGASVISACVPAGPFIAADASGSPRNAAVSEGAIGSFRSGVAAPRLPNGNGGLRRESWGDLSSGMLPSRHPFWRRVNASGRLPYYVGIGRRKGNNQQSPTSDHV